MTKRSLLFIHESLEGGGAEKVFVDLVSRIQATGMWKITIVQLFGAGTHQDSLPAGIELITIWKSRHTGLKKILWHFGSPRRRMISSAIIHALRGRSFDIGVSFMEGPAMYAHTRVFSLSGKNLTWIHVNLKINHWSKYIFRSVEHERSLYKSFDGIAFVADGVRASFSELFGIRGDKLKVIHNILEPKDILRRAKEENIPVGSRPVIINVGRLENQKRQDRLLHAAKILKDKGIDFELWILGRGTLENELKALTQKLGLASQVRFIGFKKNPYPYMDAATLMALTSDTEGWGMVLCEAMCLGTPVVATRVTGVEEVLQGGAGILTGLSAEDIADGIELLITDPSVRKKYADAAMSRAQEWRPEHILHDVTDFLLG